ncbi:putative Adenylate and Guanylate cyclase catalytic domain/Domain (DUF1935) [Leishmania naiffi]|uniref:adenylate cyclase n=1 Tax=Leishmania naiffi TaxID=5678 RepID=A0AAW3B4X0_9TRYP
MLQTQQLMMNHCKGGSTHPSATLLLLLLLLVPCAPVSAEIGKLCNVFDAKCVLLQTSEKSSIALNAADATAQKALIACTRESLTDPSTWTPTDGSGSTLNVYMSTLSDVHLSSIVAASSSTSCTLVTSISEGVLDTRSMSNHVFFTNADPATEMLGLLSYVMTSGVPPKMGFVYASTATGGTSAGAAVYEEFLRRSNELAYTGTVTTYDAAQTYDAAKFAAFVDHFLEGTSVVFFFPPASSDTDSMFARLISHSNVSNLLMPSWLIATATSQYLAATSPSVPASNVIVSSTNPHPQDTNFAVSMAQFTRDYGSVDSTLASSSAEGIEAVAGWITTQATVATLQPYTLWTEPPTQKSYFNSLFQQRLYTIGGEIVLGAYSSTCNVGGRMVVLYSLTKMYDGAKNAYYGLTSVPNATLRLKPWECHAADVTLRVGKMVRAGYVQYQAIGENSDYMTTQMETTVSSAMGSATFTSTAIGPLESLSSAAWQAVLGSSSATAVFGAASVGVDKSPVQQVLVDPVFLHPTLYQNVSNVIYLTATNEQQLGAMATWVAQSAIAPDVHAVVRNSGDSATAMQDTLHRIMADAGITIKSTRTLDAGQALSSSDFPTSGLVLLTGVILSDIGTLAAYMQSNVDTRVILLFDEVTQWYREIQIKFTTLPTSSGERLLFLTNLPPWVQKSRDVSTLSTSFLSTTIGPNYHSPASMRGYVALRVLSMMGSNAANPSSRGLLDALYTQQVLQVDDLTMGPFQRTGCKYSMESKNVECTGVVNGGASGIYLWSYSDMLMEAKGPIAGPYVVDLFGHVETADVGNNSSAKVQTSPLPKVTIITSVIMGAVIVAVMVAAGIIFAFGLGDSRDNRNAPKDANKPVTLIFTDIESSTALWATAPQAMATAVALHHKLARQLIIKHKCYEVKTIGDSFMIACKEPFAAVQLARDLQLELQQADWGSTVIDDAYASFGKLTGGTSPSECGTSPWSGLRVRAGIHCGLVEVHLDKVTKGYDYYGNVVNTAARTESISCGGQVICTSSVVDALTEEEQNTVQFVPLGPHQLRGVTAPIEMYELRTVPSRIFLSSVHDVQANPLASFTICTNADSTPNLTEGNPMLVEEEPAIETSAGIESVAEVLDVYFSPYTCQQKIKLLLKTCKCFCLSDPPRQMFTSKDAYLHALMLTVATRTSAVINFLHKRKEGDRFGPTAEIKDNAASLEMAIHRDAALGLHRHSSVFLSDVESPVAGEVKRRRTIMIDWPEEKQSGQETLGSTMVLVLDSGELLTLSGNPSTGLTEKPLKEVCEATTVYLNGTPGIRGDEVSACFGNGNGLLFRIIDKATKRWAFYNDTTNFDMHIYFSVGRASTVEWGPDVAGRVTQAENTGWYEGELLVPPLATKVLMTGHVNGYKMRYSATVPNGSE